MKRTLLFVGGLFLLLIVAVSTEAQYGSGTGAYGTVGLGGSSLNTNQVVFTNQVYLTTNAPAVGSVYYSPDGTNGAWEPNILGFGSKLVITNSANGASEYMYDPSGVFNLMSVSSTAWTMQIQLGATAFQSFTLYTNGTITLGSVNGTTAISNGIVTSSGFNSSTLTATNILLAFVGTGFWTNVVDGGGNYNINSPSGSLPTFSIALNGTVTSVGQINASSFNTAGTVTTKALVSATNTISPVAALSGNWQLFGGGPGGTNIYLIIKNSAGTPVTNKIAFNGQFP